VTIRSDAAATVHTIGALASFGLLGYSTAGNVTIDNAGIVYAISLQDAFGIYGGSGTGDVSITNAGDLTATSGFGGAFGIYASAANGIATISNGGAIQAYSTSRGALGIVASGDSVDVENAGSISAHAYTEYGGPRPRTPGFRPGDRHPRRWRPSAHRKRGSIDVHAYGNALGIVADGDNVGVENSGSLGAYSVYGDAQGIAASGASVLVENRGSVYATSTHGDAIGLLAQGYNAVLVDNSGTISATDADYAVGVSLDSTSGVSTLVNSGVIRTQSTLEGEVAVRGGDGVQHVLNYGDIYGAAITAGGDDVFTNGAGRHLARHQPFHRLRRWRRQHPEQAGRHDRTGVPWRDPPGRQRSRRQCLPQRRHDPGTGPRPDRHGHQRVGIEPAAPGKQRHHRFCRWLDERHADDRRRSRWRGRHERRYQSSDDERRSACRQR
jgi:hypothetical protein